METVQDPANVHVIWVMLEMLQFQISVFQTVLGVVVMDSVLLPIHVPATKATFYVKINVCQCVQWTAFMVHVRHQKSVHVFQATLKISPRTINVYQLVQDVITVTAQHQMCAVVIRDTSNQRRIQINVFHIVLKDVITVIAHHLVLVHAMLDTP